MRRSSEARGGGRDAGFTLGELGIVVVIVGVLAMLAIPALLGTRSSAVDASLNADLRSAGSAVTSWYVDNPLGGPGQEFTTNTEMRSQFGSYGYVTSPNNTVVMIYRGGSAFCIFAFNPGASDSKTLATSKLYDSVAGGIVERSAVPPGGACAA